MRLNSVTDGSLGELSAAQVPADELFDDGGSAVADLRRRNLQLPPQLVLDGDRSLGRLPGGSGHLPRISADCAMTQHCPGSGIALNRGLPLVSPANRAVAFPIVERLQVTLITRDEPRGAQCFGRALTSTRARLVQGQPRGTHRRRPTGRGRQISRPGLERPVPGRAASTRLLLAGDSPAHRGTANHRAPSRRAVHVAPRGVR
jgi:hypothetical protein